MTTKAKQRVVTVLTFPSPVALSLPLLSGSVPPGASAAPAVCSSFPDTRRAAASPPRSPPAQRPQRMLYSSCHHWNQLPLNRCCCHWQHFLQAPHSTQSSPHRGRWDQLPKHTVRTGNQSSPGYHCCCCCCCCCCCWCCCCCCCYSFLHSQEDAGVHPRWSASCYFHNFSQTSCRGQKL